MRFPVPGDLFEGRYRVERELGAGGFSLVFLCRRTRSDRTVALKIILPDADNGYERQTRARFDREVKIIANLSHPNTVTLYDCGTSENGLLYMVFEHVPGHDLSDVVHQHGTLEPSAVVEILRQVLGSLQEAHAQGLIHRDIKPENIRVCSQPGEPIEVRVLDFGIARSTDDSHPSITKTGELIGTPRYMSPEQLTEQPLTAQSDIYSVGMVALELLVGENALPGNRWADQLERLRTGHVFSVDVIHRIGAGLLAIVQRMTARDPADRYPTATAVLHALDSLERSSTTKLQRVASSRDESERAGSSPPLRIGVAIALAVAVVGSALWLFNRGAPADELETSTQATASNVRGLVHSNIGTSRPADAERPVDAGHMDEADLQPSPDLTAVPPFGSPGCGKKDFLAQTPPLVRVPDGYDPNKPHPAILFLHSDNQGNLMQVPGSPKFSKVLDSEQVIVIVPQAPASAWEEDHGPLAKRVVDAASADYCIDMRRVFVASAAGAGSLATFLTCEPWVAGVAIATYTEYKHHRVECETDPRPTIWINARESIHQPLQGGLDCFHEQKRPFEETMRAARARHRCSENSKTSYEDDLGARCDFWRCDIALERCIVDGGLGWPGAPRPLAATFGQVLGVCDEPAPTQSFDAAAQMWRFFERLNLGSPEASDVRRR